jgi:hypothetical protein
MQKTIVAVLFLCICTPLSAQYCGSGQPVLVVRGCCNYGGYWWRYACQGMEGQCDPLKEQIWCAIDCAIFDAGNCSGGQSSVPRHIFADAPLYAFRHVNATPSEAACTNEVEAFAEWLQRTSTNRSQAFSMGRLQTKLE